MPVRQPFTFPASGADAVRTEGAVRIAIADNGHGVPLVDRVRIFEKFAQIDGREQSVHRSSGIGLAFCKLAVEAHGGRIGIEDSDAGGSRFWFEIPTHRPQSE